MILTIDSMLHLKDAPALLKNLIKAELTIKNPDYIKKMRMGLNRFVCGPEYIKLWKEEDGVLTLPRGYYARLYEIAGQDLQISDARVLCEYIEFPRMPKLRDYQSPALELARAWQQGCIIMPCGAGKTTTAMGITAELMQPTLWITHTMDLLNQSMKCAIDNLGLTGHQIGLIQADTMTIGTHMTFATVQTLSRRDLSAIKDKFGCVIVDESHLVYKDAAKARMFESVISQFPAHYRFGLTASEFRSDGLIETMFHVIGPKFYEVPQDDPRLKVVTPTVEFIETDFQYDQGTDDDGEKKMLSVQQMYQAMREDALRDRVILSILAKQEPGDSTLVLGHSLDHLENLLERISDYFGTQYEYRFINGTTKRSEREAAIKDMREGKAHFLFATYQLAKLGLDIPRLNKLVLATPVKDKTSIQQSVGRIMRPFEGKGKPTVYDIYDSRVPVLRTWARERVRVYRSLGCEIYGGPKVRK